MGTLKLDYLRSSLATVITTWKRECWIQFRATETTEQHHIDVPEGLYDTGDNFIYVLNNLIKSAVRERSSEQGRIKFYYNRANKRASITIYEKGGVRFSNNCLRWKRNLVGKGTLRCQENDGPAQRFFVFLSIPTWWSNVLWEMPLCLCFALCL